MRPAVSRAWPISMPRFAATAGSGLAGAVFVLSDNSLIGAGGADHRARHGVARADRRQFLGARSRGPAR